MRPESGQARAGVAARQPACRPIPLKLPSHYLMTKSENFLPASGGVGSQLFQHVVSSSDPSPGRKINMFPPQDLIKPLIPPKIAKRANVRKRKGEAILAFIADIVGQFEAAVFDHEPATVPVVGDLSRSVLQLIDVRIETQVDRTAKAGFIGATVAEHRAQLVEFLRNRHAVGNRARRNLPRHVQGSGAGDHCEGADLAIEQHGAGIYPADLEVVVRIPLELVASAG